MEGFPGGWWWHLGGELFLFRKRASTALYVQTLRSDLHQRLGVFFPPCDLSQKLLSANTLMLSYREREKLSVCVCVGGMSEGHCGVNMFGAIMLDHLIMTRPSGS